MANMQTVADKIKTSPKILCVIPARLHSTRLPRKPLALINGKPMVQCVYEAARACADMHRVIVATDAQEVADIIETIGGHAEMTPSDLNTGSDRVAFVAKRYSDFDVVVNLQGDQPFVTPDMLSALVAPFLNGDAVSMTTLACPIHFSEDYKDPNTVKVIVDQNCDAIYFSRSPIPHFRDVSSSSLNEDMSSRGLITGSIPRLSMHIGLYAYTRDFLLKYMQFEQTPLEKAESLEQLRVLENGFKIRVCFTKRRLLEINTPEDLQKANCSS